MSLAVVVCSVCLLCTMKALPILVLLSSAVQLCSAAPALEPLTCSKDGSAAAARLAMHHINEHHDHGYKFRLKEIQSNQTEKVDNGCNIELQLDLAETKCHTVNPKHFEDCEIREMHARAVMANCTVMMTIKNSDAKVTKYECVTRQEHTNKEMMGICPDCPTLMPLNNPEGVNEAVEEFNKNSTNQNLYVLQEVGRILSAYIMTTGMNYYAEFVLVETRCPRGNRMVPEACKPLCPDRAHHAFCRSSYSRPKGLRSVECEFYPPTNTTALGPSELEPICRPPHHVGHPHPPGPPPHADGQGPPPHAGGQGPPPNAGGQKPPPHAGGQGPPPHAGGQGPPPHAGGQGPPTHAGGQERLQHRHPLHPFLPCNGVLTHFNPALHPICPWPFPEPQPNPRPSQS